MRRILLITVGVTPQVVTETLYGLHQEGWFPDRLILATTLLGERTFTEGRLPETTADGRFSPGLPPLDGPEGRLAQLCRTLGVTAPKLEIRVPRLEGGALIEDVSTGDEADAFADLMFEIAAEATSGAERELRVSIAGGRKTMSANAALALAFFGRASDRLYHVVISPLSLENNAAFWWPGEGGYLAAGSDPPPSDFAAARIGLHPMEVLRDRAHLDPHAIYEAAGKHFRTAVRYANEALSVENMVVDLAQQTVSLGQYRAMRPTQQSIAVLALIAFAAKTGQRLSLVGAKDERRPALDGDAARGVEAFAWFYNALRLDKIWEGRGFEEYIQDGEFDRHVARHARTFAFSEFNSPLSRLRSLVNTLEPRLAHLVLPPRSLETGFAADAISFVFPKALSTHPFVTALD